MAIPSHTSKIFNTQRSTFQRPMLKGGTSAASRWNELTLRFHIGRCQAEPWPGPNLGVAWTICGPIEGRGVRWGREFRPSRWDGALFYAGPGIKMLVITHIVQASA
jgi:hypothetical protein